ncbi:MAG: YeeE/YedE thiosulfate transporter family protein [Solirubrobacteraceae bacterium]
MVHRRPAPLGLCVVAAPRTVQRPPGRHRRLLGGRHEVSAGSLRLDWRGWFLIGLAVGAALFALIAGGPDFHGYGWLTDTFSSGAVIGLILLASGVLIGYGAKTSGGCTSGNGLSGNSLLSPASLVATATFFAVAIAVSFAIEALI